MFKKKNQKGFLKSLLFFNLNSNLSKINLSFPQKCYNTSGNIFFNLNNYIMKT